MNAQVRRIFILFLFIFLLFIFVIGTLAVQVKKSSDDIVILQEAIKKGKIKDYSVQLLH